VNQQSLNDVIGDWANAYLKRLNVSRRSGGPQELTSRTRLAVFFPEVGANLVHRPLNQGSKLSQVTLDDLHVLRIP